MTVACLHGLFRITKTLGWKMVSRMLFTKACICLSIMCLSHAIYFMVSFYFTLNLLDRYLALDGSDPRGDAEFEDLLFRQKTLLDLFLVPLLAMLVWWLFLIGFWRSWHESSKGVQRSDSFSADRAEPVITATNHYRSLSGGGSSGSETSDSDLSDLDHSHSIVLRNTSIS